MRTGMRTVATLFSAVTLAGCVGGATIDDGVKGGDGLDDGKADSSVEATILDFELDAELSTASSWNLEGSIRNQLLYTIGHLNGNRSVGRLDRLTLTNIVRTGNRVTYHAKMPVAWGSKTNLPTSYEFKLPKDVDNLDAFTTKYRDACTDSSPHEIDSGSMWYYYRPRNSGCTFDAADIAVTTAAATVSTVNTNGKYPEYDKVWEDRSFKIVSIFGKYEDGATSSGDAGISAYNAFIRQVRTQFPTAVTTPPMVATNPGVAAPDVQLDVTLADGRTVQVNALLVDNISSATADFYTRYNKLSTRADLIAYNGHAGLGQNVRALARKGAWVAGQYLILFMNGCDTYAYVDGSLAQTRAAINSDDPTGTRYLDFVVNAEPSFFHQDAPATMALIKGLLKTDAPLTYQGILGSIDRSQVVLVTGEEDNVFQPGGGNPPPAWAGLDESGTVAKAAEKRFQTPVLAAGSYTFEITGTSDADLYVRANEAPTTTKYDCRPYKSGSAEKCTMTLAAPALFHVMVRGYAASSTFHLTAH
jgi:hypothetical protein